MASGARKRAAPDPYRNEAWERNKGKVNEKLERARPYGFFLSTIESDPTTHGERLSVSFPELLDKSLGDLTESLHINFMIELGWLLAQYFITEQRGKIVSLLYEECDEDLMALNEQKKIPNLRFKKVKTQNAWSHHHTKLSMFAYNDGSVRVVVMTANLRENDWINLTQGIWVSPKFPLKQKDDKSDADSKTGFKKDLLRYLRSYNVSLLTQWIQKIEIADFSEANVPGKHDEPLWGQKYLKNILRTHACLPCGMPSTWPIISQCSSLGSLGKDEKDWLYSQFVENLSASTNKDKTKGLVPFNLIYPSMNDVLKSCDGPISGFCLPYSDNVHQKQTWLKSYMCKWISNSRKRTKNMPHIKTYCRISPSCEEMSWFLLTSANLSKAAWGVETKSNHSCYIRSHEAGVLFLPQFLTGCDTFSLDQNRIGNDISPPFPLPFDLPLTTYSKTDQPWRADSILKQ